MKNEEKEKMSKEGGREWQENTEQFKIQSGESEQAICTYVKAKTIWFMINNFLNCS